MAFNSAVNWSLNTNLVHFALAANTAYVCILISGNCMRLIVLVRLYSS